MALSPAPFPSPASDTPQTSRPIATRSGAASKDRRCTPIDGSAYRPGLEYRKADLHLHSNYSYDVLNLPELSPRALYEKAVARGMGFFTLTDHETIRGVVALRRELERDFGDEPPIPVINGIEIKVRDPRIGHTIHVNILGLDQRQWLELARRRHSVDDFLAFCRDESLYHAYNHPFWFERRERGRLEVITELIHQFPVIELNAGRIPQLNRRTLDLSRRFGKEVVATSDSHTGRVAKAYTMAPGRTPEEFLQNIRAGVSRAVPRHAGFLEFMEEVGEAIDLVFLKQKAFRPKKTFLREMPVARKIAVAALASEIVMRPKPLKLLLSATMHVVAGPPAYAFILKQRRMDGRLEEAEQTLGMAGLWGAEPAPARVNS
ncbi:MAG: PHP domain-containing protein [Candidatus Eisenbacteria bacterium]